MKKIVLLISVLSLFCLYTASAFAEEQIIKKPRVNVFNRAVKNGDINKVRKYINAGFNPNETYMAASILCTAIERKQNAMLDFLLANGATADNPKSHPQPLYYAVVRKNPYAVEKLLNAGANCNNTYMGHTAECLALTLNYTDIINVFQKFRENKKQNNNNKSTICGIGVQLLQDGNKVFIIRIMKNSPAEKEYLPVGSQILQVNNNNVKNLSIDKVSDLIKGEKDTTVTLLVKSNSGKNLYSIKRAPLSINSYYPNYGQNFNMHWKQIAPAGYEDVPPIYTEIFPQYSRQLKQELMTTNYWANRKVIFKNGYDVCMTYSKKDQNACLINLVNREIAQTHNDEQLLMQEKLYQQQAIHNSINSLERMETINSLDRINSSIQDNNFHLNNINHSIQDTNYNLYRINNTLRGF